jgi:hypothetical protein
LSGIYKALALPHPNQPGHCLTEKWRRKKIKKGGGIGGRGGGMGGVRKGIGGGQGQEEEGKIMSFQNITICMSFQWNRQNNRDIINMWLPVD